MNPVSLLFDCIANHTNSDRVAIDIETTGLERGSEIVSAAVALTKGRETILKSFWIDRFHQQSPADQNDFERLLAATIFNHQYKGTIIFHNLDFDFRFLLDRYHAGKKLTFSKMPLLMDTLTISRVTRNNKFISHADSGNLKCHSLKYLAKEFLAIDHSTFEGVVDRTNIRFANRDDVLKYNQRDAEITLHIFEYSKANIDKKEWQYIEKIEMPHLLSLVQMNWHGVHYDIEAARNIFNDLTSYADILESEITVALGRSINIQSHIELT